MTNRNQSYKQIVKSTGIFGGSQIVIILLGMIRTKFAAILLGSFGIGLIGIYQSVVDIVRSISILGVDTSSIKEIADAKANKSNEQFEKTISSFLLWFTLTAFLGLFICIVFCFQISTWAFDSPKYAMHIAALSVSVFFGVLATGRSVMLQSLRQIGYMAKAGMWTALASLLFVIPIFYIWGTKAIIPSLIFSSIALFFFSDFYFRKLKLNKVKVNNQDAFQAGTNWLKLGIYILASAILSTAAMFIIRAYVVQNDSVESAGLFQATWVITTVYLGLILKSMGTDFFPRLSAIADSNDKVKTLVNEQSYIAILTSTPIIIGMLLTSQIILTLLYSSEFTPASSLLRWLLLGSLFKIYAWPIAFILLAKSSGKLFLLSEVIFYSIFLGVSYILYSSYGLDAIGMGYLIAYISYFVCIATMAKGMSKFCWSNELIQIILISLLLTTFAFTCLLCLNTIGIGISAILLIVSSIYSLMKLRKVFSYTDLKKWIYKKEK